MLKLKLILCILLSAFSLVNSALAEDSKPAPFVVSGVLMNSGSAALIDRFVNYLSNQSGYKLTPLFVDSYTELSRVMRKNPRAIAWTCGAPFVQDHYRDGQRLISLPLFNKKPQYHSFVITKINRPEKTLKDFAGKILAYSDLRSNSGYVSPSVELKKQGIELEKHFRLTILAGNHERSIQSVVSGLADVAAVDEYIWVEYVKRNPDIVNKLKVIEKNGPYPFTPIVASKFVPNDIISKLQQVLSNLPETKEGAALLGEFGLDGFETREIEYFESMKKTLQIMQWDLG